ncbi:MAG: hypothetical protein AABN34_14735 [Acidobacteriota bacterium]
MDAGLYKDEILDRLASTANVAQFVSYAADGTQRYSRIHGQPFNRTFGSLEAAAEALLNNAPDGMANVRSFAPHDAKSREFVYGLKRVTDIVATVRRLNESGLFAIVNETIDVNDGGVSGVAMAGVIEFAPGDTPRCVEKPGTASLNRGLGLQLLERVYRFHPSLDYDASLRVEFSLHPKRRGFHHQHTVIWEVEAVEAAELAAVVSWPNRFSRFLGDKAFGLLVADSIGLPVPRTTVIPRRVAPFEFGIPTGTCETWIRTCPIEQEPGRFTTNFGWLDPFSLLAEQDPHGDSIASVISQESIPAVFSGALIASAEGEPIIEGVPGYGPDFMLGGEAGVLPHPIYTDVSQLFEKAAAALGPVRFEWVHDGDRAWIVQLHRGATLSSGRTIYPGEARSYQKFHLCDGIDKLRELIRRVRGGDEGIAVVGNIGLTSHLGDLLRQAKIPSHIEPPDMLSAPD